MSRIASIPLVLAWLRPIKPELRAQGLMSNSLAPDSPTLSLLPADNTTGTNKIKQRINNQEMVSYEYLEKYKDIAPCLLLHFETEPKTRPIREHRFEEYEVLFQELEK